MYHQFCQGRHTLTCRTYPPQLLSNHRRQLLTLNPACRSVHQLILHCMNRGSREEEEEAKKKKEEAEAKKAELGSKKKEELMTKKKDAVESKKRGRREEERGVKDAHLDGKATNKNFFTFLQSLFSHNQQLTKLLFAHLTTWMKCK